MTDFAEALADFSRPDTDGDTLHQALRVIDATPPDEAAEVWLRVVDDVRYSAQRRRQALVRFFLRHVRPGSTLAEPMGHQPISDALAQATVQDQSTASKLPFDRTHGKCVLMVRPELPPGDDTAIYLLLSDKVPTEFLPAGVPPKSFDLSRVRIVDLVAVETDP